MKVVDQPEATALGTAICGAVAAGLFSDPIQASEQMVQVTREIQPNPNNAEVYDRMFRRYVATYPQLRELMHEVAAEQS